MSRWILRELEPASFEVERFELGPDARLEVHGRWSGVRGRRFMRPTLTGVAGGREHRLLAVLDHKPWIPEEGEAWLAAFPCSTDPAALRQTELTVAPDVTVPLPPPSVKQGGRRRRTSSRQVGARKTGDSGQPDGRPKDRAGTHESRLREERDAALRSREETLAELDDAKRDRDRLRLELGEALVAHEAVIAERHDAIEAEVRLRIADLRAETERERAATAQAAQFAHERDMARAERAEALSERDEAHAERDFARLERNRMLAQRDTARSRAEEAMRRWEATAALGTRRTHERDAAASERDRVVRERDTTLDHRDRLVGERDAAEQQRDAALEQRDRVARQRDNSEEERDRVARERDAVLEERDRATRERDAVLEERDRAARERDSAQEQLLQVRALLPTPDERAGPQLDREDPPAISDEAPVPASLSSESERETAAGDPDSRGPGAPSPPTTPMPTASKAPRRPPRPPAPAETRPGHSAGGTMYPIPSPAVVARRDDADIWRARLFAIAALLIAFIVFVVILTAK